MTQHTPVALITGCSSGIGRATAKLLAERGWRVFATARRLETINDLANDHITSLRLDVTNEESMTSAVEQVLAQAGRIDALVNNAGYTEVGPLEEAVAEDIRRQFETNTFGALRMAQLVLPTMRAQGSGRIVNVSTMGGRVVIPFIGLYNASKFALEAMSDALRMETRPFGVRVIVVEPGGVRTNFNDTAHQRAQRFATDANSPYHRYFEPLNRFITQATASSSPPETVARVIAHALTTNRPRARYVATPDARIMLAIVPWLSDRKRDTLWGWLLGLREMRTAG
jgi:NAD(P)-dependent dehydrogenase (short-subunit alcohol dehydrogenase family)